MRAVRSPLTALSLATVAAAGVIAAATPAASAATCGTIPFAQLYGVAATSASNAWAVGNQPGDPAAQTLIEHWDGTAWCVVASPSPSGSSEPSGLQSVAATSATNAWAVGDYTNSSGTWTLILRWNGTAWTQVPSPNPSGGTLDQNSLSSVAATSATNAWAVGAYDTSTGSQTLILHWNGTSWTQLTSPNPGSFRTLSSVAATSASRAWAVGHYNVPAKTLTMRWNGTAWKHVASPNPESGTAHSNFLAGVAATSASNAWAVGDGESGSGQVQNLVLHWNGAAWTPVASPQPGTGPDGSALSAVAATSASNAWAVGYSSPGSVTQDTMILRWNGTAWTQAASPSPGGSAPYDTLYAVAATSAGNAWAVGTYDSGTTAGTLILHWDGATWTQVTSP
jgi:hypothetical protein